MYCEFCGKPVSDYAKYCRSCGATLEYFKSEPEPIVKTDAPDDSATEEANDHAGTI